MELRYPENFVSYNAGYECRHNVATQLEEVNKALVANIDSSSLNDLKARRIVLTWQAMLGNADQAFEQGHYKEALAGYREVSKKILELINPKIAWVVEIDKWPKGAQLTAALIDASRGLLSFMIPPHEPAPFLGLDREVFNIDKLGGLSTSSVEMVAATVPEVVQLSEKAANAIIQEHWDDAARFYTQALKSVPPNQPLIKGEILLNLGAVEVRRDQSRTALRHLMQAKKIFYESEDSMGTAQASHNIALAYLIAGQSEKAERSMEEARKIASQASLHDLLVSEQTYGTFKSSVSLDALQQPQEGSSLIQPPIQIGTENLAGTLSSNNLSLKIRAISKNALLPDLKLETAMQREQEKYVRSLSLKLGDRPIALRWSKDEPLSSVELKEKVYTLRKQSGNLKDTGYRVFSDVDIAVNLPHLYHLVLSIKMGDCHNLLGEYEMAQEQYQRAASYDLINLSLEAPDLWRRIAANIRVWGDSLYRDKVVLEEAKKVYGLVLSSDGSISNSFLYTESSLKPTGDRVSAWLDAVFNNRERPDLNPAIASELFTVLKRWKNLNAELDFFGNEAKPVLPFSFRYLQDVARYMASRANQVEQRYIDFKTQYEKGNLAREDLNNAFALSTKGKELAEYYEQAALKNKQAAGLAKTLSKKRKDNAEEMKKLFEEKESEIVNLASKAAYASAYGNKENIPDWYNPTWQESGDGQMVLVDAEAPVYIHLSRLAGLQTTISNELQKKQMENTISELNEACSIADKQFGIAEDNYNAAEIERKIAEERERQAEDMLDSFDKQEFNPDQWFFMASLMKRLAYISLERAIEIALIMEVAYNFENFDNRRIIRSSYKPASTNGLLGSEELLSDIDSFTHYHVTNIKHKSIPVKWGISLAEEYPGHFVNLLNTGRMDFEIDLERVAIYHPGTFHHRLVGAELEFDGFLPPHGLHGRLTNSGLGRFRDADGQTQLRLQPAETMVLSRYNRRQDAMILVPSQEMRGLFEGISVASGWTLELPKISNDIDLRWIFDIRLVLYFECLFDSHLFEKDSQPPAGLFLERSRSFYLYPQFPDAFYQLRESGKATIELSESDFPRNHNNPVLSTLAVAFATEKNVSLEGTRLVIQHPGTRNPAHVTITEQNLVLSDKLPINSGASALGSYTVEIDPTQIERKEQIADIVLVLKYVYSPTPW